MHIAPDGQVGIEIYVLKQNRLVGDGQFCDLKLKTQKIIVKCHSFWGRGLVFLLQFLTPYISQTSPTEILQVILGMQFFFYTFLLG